MEDLFTEIESTIDQLITNVQVLMHIAFDPKFGEETHGLQKTQESLLAKLIELDTQLESLGLKSQKSKRMHLIEEKLSHFGHLNCELTSRAYSGK